MWKKPRKSGCRNITARTRVRGAEAMKEHGGLEHAGAGAKVQEAWGGRLSGGHRRREREQSLLTGRGAPEDTSMAKEDSPSKASHHTTPPAPGVARPATGSGRVMLMLPDLSKCEGSCVLTPEECPAYSSQQGQQTPCRDWPS
jgi:hypothetical protein